MQFAKNLRELRAKQNITQEALADKIGVSRQMVARYESGENYPELDKVIEIAKTLNCKLDDLVNGKDFAQNFNPLAMPTVSVKIEKPKMSLKDKIPYAILSCFISLFVFAALIGVCVAAFGDNSRGATIGGAFFGCLMPASWFAIAMYFKAR